MKTRDNRIVEAAGQLFARYGVGKTTMNDISREAGVARQTLYNAYSGKDEVLRAVVRHNIEETRERVLARWSEASDLGRKLDIYFEEGPLAWYDLIQSSPDLAELLDGLHRIAKEEMEQLAAQWTDMFAVLLQDVGVAAGDQSDLADFIYATSINAKYNAVDRNAVASRLRVLKASVLALVSGDS